LVRFESAVEIENRNVCFDRGCVNDRGEIVHVLGASGPHHRNARRSELGVVGIHQKKGLAGGRDEAPRLWNSIFRQLARGPEWRVNDVRVSRKAVSVKGEMTEVLPSERMRHLLRQSRVRDSGTESRQGHRERGKMGKRNGCFPGNPHKLQN
jgi:hypothetical protein